MNKGFRDLSFMLMLMFLIAVGGYWIMEELQKDYLDQYLILLGDKLTEMMSSPDDRQEIAQAYSRFREQVRENQISPQEVEQIAAGIFNVSILHDSLSLDEAQALLKIRVKGMADSLGKNGFVIDAPETVEITDESEWRELSERLESVYRFDKYVERLNRDGKMYYRVDPRLNVVIDTEIRKAMEHVDETLDKKFRKELRELEEKQLVIWRDSLLENQLRMQRELQQLADSSSAMMDQAKDLVFKYEFSMDSLKTRIEQQEESIRVSIQNTPPGQHRNK